MRPGSERLLRWRQNTLKSKRTWSEVSPEPISQAPSSSSPPHGRYKYKFDDQGYLARCLTQEKLPKIKEMEVGSSRSKKEEAQDEIISGSKFFPAWWKDTYIIPPVYWCIDTKCFRQSSAINDQTALNTNFYVAFCFMAQRNAFGNHKRSNRVEHKLLRWILLHGTEKCCCFYILPARIGAKNTIHPYFFFSSTRFSTKFSIPRSKARLTPTFTSQRSFSCPHFTTSLVKGTWAKRSIRGFTVLRLQKDVLSHSVSSKLFPIYKTTHLSPLYSYPLLFTRIKSPYLINISIPDWIISDESLELSRISWFQWPQILTSGNTNAMIIEQEYVLLDSKKREHRIFYWTKKKRAPSILLNKKDRRYRQKNTWKIFVWTLWSWHGRKIDKQPHLVISFMRALQRNHEQFYHARIPQTGVCALKRTDRNHRTLFFFFLSVFLYFSGQ